VSKRRIDVVVWPPSAGAIACRHVGTCEEPEARSGAIGDMPYSIHKTRPPGRDKAVHPDGLSMLLVVEGAEARHLAALPGFRAARA